jgi:hypothetical protein
MIDINQDGFEVYEKENKELNYSLEVFLLSYKIFFSLKDLRRSNYKGMRDLDYYIPGCFWIAGLLIGERRTQAQIAKTFNTSVLRVRTSYRFVKKLMNIDIPA